MKSNIIIAYILMTMGIVIINFSKSFNGSLFLIGMLCAILVAGYLIFIRKNLKQTQIIITIAYILLAIGLLYSFLSTVFYWKNLLGNYYLPKDLFWEKWTLLWAFIAVLHLASLYIKKADRILRNMTFMYAVLVAAWGINVVTWHIAYKLLMTGLLLLALYLAFKYRQDKQISLKAMFLHFLIYAHPVLLTISIVYYLLEPYRQTIILPKGYEGLVVIQYNEPQGAPKEYTGGFLGIGRSWLIKVNRNGRAKTQHKYVTKHVPIIGIEWENSNYLTDAKIYYDDDLNTPIPIITWIPDPTEDYSRDVTVPNNLKHNLPFAFFYGDAITIENDFVVTKPSNYLKHFVLNPNWLKTSETSQYIYKPQYLKTIDSLWSHYRYQDSLFNKKLRQLTSPTQP